MPDTLNLIRGRRYEVHTKTGHKYSGRYQGDGASSVNNEWSHVFGPVEESGAIAVWVAVDNVSSIELLPDREEAVA